LESAEAHARDTVRGELDFISYEQHIMQAAWLTVEVSLCRYAEEAR